MSTFTFAVPKRKKRVFCKKESPLPVPIATVAGRPASAHNWENYTGHLVDGHVIVKDATDAQELYKMVCIIHVNPPSLVRSLRHFGIAENLRPGDENLRHLTVTSRFKIIASNFHAFSTFCFSQRSMVGEIIRVSFTRRARSRPTFHAMMTRTRKPDISETDVSSKKMNIQKKCLYV